MCFMISVLLTFVDNYYFAQSQGRFVPSFDSPRNGFFPSSINRNQPPDSYQEQTLFVDSSSANSRRLGSRTSLSQQQQPPPQGLGSDGDAVTPSYFQFTYTMHSCRFNSRWVGDLAKREVLPVGDKRMLARDWVETVEKKGNTRNDLATLFISKLIGNSVPHSIPGPQGTTVTLVFLLIYTLCSSVRSGNELYHKQLSVVDGLRREGRWPALQSSENECTAHTTATDLS
ncbi:AAEL012789-PA [Aedes aegypti]|uniref:AAEL012789-PA n=1 Tax=Aedes aegypti TaxID=7159 RepID=Q16L22_AEDAE|nr:AAEL012789-PA [Aedes aegypti]